MFIRVRSHLLLVLASVVAGNGYVESTENKLAHYRWRDIEMERIKRLGWALVIIGVIANNYVYLHDLVFDKHDGEIMLGGLAIIAIIATLVVIAVGLFMAWKMESETV